MTKEEILAKLQEDIQLRGLSKNTLMEYMFKARLYMEYFGKPADQLDEQNIREYLLFLKNTKNMANGSVNTYNSTLRFLYGVTLNTTLNLWQIPRLKQNRSLICTAACKGGCTHV